MRTTKILLSLFFIALLYAGCKKEKDINGSLTGEGGTGNAQRIAPEDMESVMNNFIQSTWPDGLGGLYGGGSVDYDSYEAQDALLIVEAALNYGTCRPDSDYDEIAADTLTFNIDVTRDAESGEFILSGSDMYTFFPIIKDSAGNAKNRVTFDEANDPFNIVVDLEFTLFNPNSQNSSQTVIIKMITWVGNLTGGHNCSWNSSTDYWHPYGPPYGYGCNGNGSTSSWAIPEIQKRLSPLCRAMCAGSYVGNVTTLDFDPYTNNYTSCVPYTCFSNSYVPYSAFWLDFPSSNDCLSPTLLDCETYDIKFLANCATYKPAGSSVVSYYMSLGLSIQYPYYSVHRCRVKYAQCHEIN